MADPGLPVGGVHPLGGRGPPTWALFSENVCKNERIGSHRGWHAPGMPPRSANVIDSTGFQGDTVRMCEEIMMNDDNLESNLLTSNLLKMLVQILLQAEPEICVEIQVEVGMTGELLIFIRLGSS